MFRSRGYVWGSGYHPDDARGAGEEVLLGEFAYGGTEVELEG